MSSETRVSVVVSPSTGTVCGLFVWQEGHDWQAGFTVEPTGACVAWVENEDGTDEMFLHPDGGQQAAFDSLHAALKYYAEHPLAVPHFGLSAMPLSGEIIVG